MHRNNEIERISVYPGDVEEEKREKLYRFLRESGIQFSYEAY
jgi:hypothetical protein